MILVTTLFSRRYSMLRVLVRRKTRCSDIPRTVSIQRCFPLPLFHPAPPHQKKTWFFKGVRKLHSVFLDPRKINTLFSKVFGRPPLCIWTWDRRNKSYVKHLTTQRMSRIRANSERTLTGKVRMNAYKDRVAETERVKERKKSSSRKRCRCMCLWNPGMRSGWRIDMRMHLARMKDNTTRTKRQTSTLVREDWRQHMKCNLTS